MFCRLTVRFSALAMILAICVEGNLFACISPHAPRPVMIKSSTPSKPKTPNRRGPTSKPGNNDTGKPSLNNVNANDGLIPEMQWSDTSVAGGTTDIGGTADIGGTGTGEDHHHGGGTDRAARWNAFQQMQANNATIAANANKWADRYGALETGAIIVKWTCVAANIFFAPFAATGMAIGGGSIAAGDAAVKVYVVGVGSGAATGFADGTATRLAEGGSVGEAVSHGGKKAVASAIVNGLGGAIPGGGKVTSMLVNAGTAGADELIGGAVGQGSSGGGGSSYSDSSVPNELYSPMGYDTTSSGQKMYH